MPAFLLVSAILFTSCTVVSRDEAFVEKTGRSQLISYAANPTFRALWDAGNVDVPQELWPSSFPSEQVIAVKLYFGGVKIVLEKTDDHERGIYVSSAPNQAPESGSGIEFTQLAEQIYSYTEKTRTPYMHGPTSAPK